MYTRAIQYHSFLKYGVTIRSSDELGLLSAYRYEKRECPEKNPDHLETYDRPIFIEPADGIGILVVQTGGETETFLFARPVQINPGVAFAVLPYACECSYYLYWIGEQTLVPFVVDDYIRATTPQFHIEHIYTFLYSVKNSNYIFKGEKHAFWELMYVDSGMICCTVDQQKYILKQGDVIFYHPNEFHSLRALGKNPISFLNIAFNFTSSTEVLSGHMYAINSDIQRSFQKMIEETENVNEYSVDLVSTYLKLIILQLQRLKDLKGSVPHISSNSATSERQRWVEQVCLLVDQNICNAELSVAFIAQQMHVSTSYLYRLFTEEKKQSLQSFIAKRKLEMAKKLIGAGNYTITEISEMLNFCSPTYFATKFKETYGYTPREYSKTIFLK